jgi:tetratricopeptide (TPR) repeat protein
MKSAILVAAGAALALSLPAPAAAQGQAVFRGCDGFRAPGRSGDGMNRRAASIFSLQIALSSIGMSTTSTTSMGGKGVEACDTALASPLLLPEHALRRASLTRGRGIHRLAVGDAQGALADFAASDELAGSGEPLYRRSLGLGTQVMRAYALNQAGRKDEAVAAARAAAAARPTNPELALAAARIVLAANGDWDGYLAALRGIARYNPDAVQSLFGLAMVRGRWDEMLALQPHIVFAVPHTRDGSGSGGTNAALAANFISQVEIDGASAFALAALGRKAQAEAALAGIGRRIDEALTEPTLPPGVTDRSTIRRETRRHRAFSLNADRMRARYGFWRKLTELRLLADARPAEAAVQAAAKLAILADAAKYDASCASSGTPSATAAAARASARPRAWASATLMRRTAAASRCSRSC